jgi:hypothetical protein
MSLVFCSSINKFYKCNRLLLPPNHCRTVSLGSRTQKSRLPSRVALWKSISWMTFNLIISKTTMNDIVTISQPPSYSTSTHTSSHFNNKIYNTQRGQMLEMYPAISGYDYIATIPKNAYWYWRPYRYHIPPDHKSGPTTNRLAFVRTNREFFRLLLPAGRYNRNHYNSLDDGRLQL